MAEQFDVSVEDFPHVVAQFADTVGGEEYREGVIDGFEITKRIIGRSAMGRSFVRFGAERTRLNPNGEAERVEYSFYEGSTTYVGEFPDEVEERLREEDMEYDLSDKRWCEERTTFTYTPGETGVGGLIVVDQANRYGSGGMKLIDIPLLAGLPLYTDPESLFPPATVRETANHKQMFVVEFAQEGAEEVATTLHAVSVDSFEAIVAGMQSEMDVDARRVDKVESYIRKMVTIMETFPTIVDY